MADKGFIEPVLVEQLKRLGLLPNREADEVLDLHDQNTDTYLDKDGTNEVTAAQAKAAVTASHAQNADTKLDEGGANEVAVADVKSAVDASHDQNTDTKLDEGGSDEVTAAQIKAVVDKGVADAALMAYYRLGAPDLAVDDAIVASEAMDNKSYTLTSSPYTMDVPRNVTITRTVNGGADTPGEVLVTGTNINDEVITETIIPGATGVLVAGAKAFKTVTDITGSGWTIADTADDLIVGFGNEIGCHVGTDDADDIILGFFDGSIAAANASVDASGVVELTTVDFSSGTYDGSKEAMIFQKV